MQLASVYPALVVKSSRRGRCLNGMDLPARSVELVADSTYSVESTGTEWVWCNQ